MKKLLICILVLTSGCAPQYEVVQKLQVNMYHLINTRTQDVEIILSSDSLSIGQTLKKKKINIIAEVD